MTNPLTEARDHVTTVLEDVGFTVHAGPPEKISPPAAWVAARDPWVENVTLGASRVHLQVYVAVAMTAGNKASLTNLEDKVWTVLQALRAGNVQTGSISVPEASTDTNQNVAVATIQTTVHVTDN